MNPAILRSRSPSASRRGSVLIIVLWVAFGLVSLTLYFAHSMTLHLRTSDNIVAAAEADEAMLGALRYATNFLANLENAGKLPDRSTYATQAEPLGDAKFWFIGRSESQATPAEPTFDFVDEASKLNLNTATPAMLAALPRMTEDLAAAIIDWRDTDSNLTQGGAEDDIYLRLNPPHKCKNSPFETIGELRMVYGFTPEILLGEDTNLNGILDANENDGNALLPEDNRDGRLDPGILEYVTVYSSEANTRTNGSARINVASGQQQELVALLKEKFGDSRASEIQRQLGGAGPGVRSVLEFYIRSRMTVDEFSQISTDITTTNATSVQGLVNVNTASEAVLATIPGIGTDYAPSLVNYRQSNKDKLTSVAWVAEVLDREKAIAAGPYLTGRGYQFTADVAAVGHHGRGYRRSRFVIDTTQQPPRILYRQDLTNLGWALGKTARNDLLAAEGKR